MAKPEKRFRCGGCDAAVFENEITRGGKTVKVKKVAFQKCYKNSEGEWETTYSLDINKIPKAILAHFKAYENLLPDWLSKSYITFFKVTNRNQNFVERSRRFSGRCLIACWVHSWQSKYLFHFI